MKEVKRIQRWMTNPGIIGKQLKEHEVKVEKDIWVIGITAESCVGADDNIWEWFVTTSDDKKWNDVFGVGSLSPGNPFNIIMFPEGCGIYVEAGQVIEFYSYYKHKLAGGGTIVVYYVEAE